MQNRWETHIKPKLEIIEAWARNGVIDKDIAKNLGVAYSTFREYAKREPALSAALKKNKAEADLIVESALYRKAVGHMVKVRKAFKLKESGYDANGKKYEKEKIDMAEEEMYIPPDTAALIFWLRNRKGEDWRNNPDVNLNTNAEITVEMEDRECAR